MAKSPVERGSEIQERGLIRKNEKLTGLALVDSIIYFARLIVGLLVFVAVILILGHLG
jgi:hypothetical protein